MWWEPLPWLVTTTATLTHLRLRMAFKPVSSDYRQAALTKLYIIWVTLYFCCYKEECCKVSGPSVFRPFMLAITYQYRVVKLCILKSITSLDRPRCNSSWVFEGWSIYHLCTQYQESVICKECTFPCFSIILYIFNGRELVWRISAFCWNGFCCPQRMQDN